MPKKNTKVDKDKVIFDLYRTLNQISIDLDLNLEAMNVKAVRIMVDLARRRAFSALEIPEAAAIFEDYENGE